MVPTKWEHTSRSTNRWWTQYQRHPQRALATIQDRQHIINSSHFKTNIIWTRSRNPIQISNLSTIVGKTVSSRGEGMVLQCHRPRWIFPRATKQRLREFRPCSPNNKAWSMLSTRARMLWAILVAQVHTLTESCMMMKEVWLHTVANFKLQIRVDFRPSSSTILKCRRLVPGKGGQLMEEAWSLPTTLLSRTTPPDN